MIGRRTVFVLGAGASKPYGFPLGNDLTTEILNGLERGKDLRLKLLNADFREGDINDFQLRLREAGGRSIDFFLEGQSDELVSIGRVAIGLSIVRAEHECHGKGLLVREPPATDPWLTYLWERIRPGSTVKTLADNQISFITFNYDRTLEEFFTTVIKSNFPELPTREAARKVLDRAFPIVHLHGAIAEDGIPFGRDYDTISHSGILSRKTGEGLRLMNDATGPDRKQLDASHNLLRSAEQVCFLGFGFHRWNTERLELATLKEEQIPIFGSAFEMGGTELRAANKWVGRSWKAGQTNQRCAEFLRQNVDLY